eukprot:TRINITY_DN40487_c0_g1_i1.p1 TRINITY_DN40487_c0_g1~~TRINITY_DN40487_c0_g1_i1.p1  ORF type:complete len:328 (+),score=48.75 TRINITY_DN40487_c0_g1_i1:33-986(+)
MKLDIYRSLWGVIKTQEGPWELEEALQNIAELNFYAGVEVPLKVILHYGKQKFMDLLASHKLKLAVMVFTDGPVAPGHSLFGGAIAGHPIPGPSVEEHLACFKAQVSEAYSAPLVTQFINSHSGNDYFTAEMTDKFFEAALKCQKEGGYKVYHETHRKRILYSPWVVRDVVVRHPDLELVADLSHFTCVAETNPHDPVLTQLVRSIAPKVRHIHARVGFDHGPQVPDPAAPEWASYTQGFEAWWDIIWAAQRENGTQVSTLTPEHGPPNYQWALPFTRQPIADIWKVNHWVATRQRERFESAATASEGTPAKRQRSN